MMEGRRILVTGASSGIGQAVAERLLAAGARVVGVARDFSRNPIARAGFDIEPLDLAELDMLPDRLRELLRRHPDIDGLVSCAGAGRFGSLEEFSFEQIRALLDLNLTAHIQVVRALLPQLKRRGAGDIVLLGSENALQGGPKGAVYAAAKAGLRGLAQSLRQECAASGVRVTLINPGLVRTAFFDELHFAPGEDPANYIEPADVAELIHTVLALRPGTVVDEINLSPLKKVLRFDRR